MCHRVFYPYGQQGLAITSEVVELVKLLPVYFERYLQPERSRLKKRASVVRANRTDWWGLSERRAWALDLRPRIVSKYFGGPGGFTTDLEARYIVVQGFAWFPKWTSSLAGLPIQDVLAAYIAVMNSTPFARLLEIFSPHVAGGQFDLSARYVRFIPVPHLPALSADERTGHLITQLAELGNRPRFSDPDCVSRRTALPQSFSVATSSVRSSVVPAPLVVSKASLITHFESMEATLGTHVSSARIFADWNVVPLVVGLVDTECEYTARNRGPERSGCASTSARRRPLGVGRLPRRVG